jgi:hypothetical protein
MASAPFFVQLCFRIGQSAGGVLNEKTAGALLNVHKHVAKPAALFWICIFCVSK